MSAPRTPALAPFRRPAFRLFLLQDLAGRIGLWGFEFAVAWIVLEKTGSGTAAALVQTMIVLPMPPAMLAAGTLTDRFGPRRLMILAWAATVLVMLATASVLSSSSPSIPAVLVLMALLGLAIALYVVPAQVYVGRSVEPPLMANALGMTWLSFGGAQLIGGALGGVALQAAGPTVALGLGALACAVAAVLAAVLPELTGGHVAAGNLLGDAVAALPMLRRSRPIRETVLLGCAAAAFVTSYVAVVPLVARNLLAGEASAQGLMLAFGGMGSITAALVVGRVGRAFGRGRTIVGTLALGSAAMAVLGLSHVTLVSAVLVAIVSASSVSFTATAILVIQASSPQRLRGRAVALYNAPSYTILPLGEAVAGVLSDAWGVGNALVGIGLLGSVIALAAAAGSSRRAIAARPERPADA